MAQVKVLRSVNHNGVKYGADEVIGDLTQHQAAQLIDSGEAVKAGAGEQASAGKRVPPKPSAVRDSVKGKPAAGDKKTVSEKAQEREQAKADAANGGTPAGEEDLDDQGGDQTEVELPESFTTPEGEYSVKRNVKGHVSGYQFAATDAAEGDKPAVVKKADYQTAYEASVDAAGQE